MIRTGPACRSTLLQGMWASVPLLLLSAAPVYANTAVPFRGVAWSVAWVLLGPIVLIEALVARRVLGVSFDRSLRLSLWANAVSTVPGVLAVWLLPTEVGFTDSSVGVIAMLLFGIPYDQHHFAELAFGAAALACLPCFIMSVFCERLVVRRLEPWEWPRVRRWAWQANALSYVPVFLLFTLYFLYAAPGWSRKAWAAECLSNLKVTGRCLQEYEVKFGDRIPRAADFTALARQLSGCQELRLDCPASRRRYLFNTALSGMRAAGIPAGTPLVRDAEPHIGLGFCVLFADGSAKLVPETDARLRAGIFQ